MVIAGIHEIILELAVQVITAFFKDAFGHVSIISTGWG
jgi:hypothetical protein